MGADTRTDPAATGRLDPRAAFVVQFRVGSRVGGPLAGRVEHVSTGRQIRFSSLEELEAFVGEMLSRVAGGEAEPNRPR